MIKYNFEKLDQEEINIILFILQERYIQLLQDNDDRAELLLDIIKKLES